MRLCLKTADQICQVWLDETKFESEMGRNLSKDLLRFLQRCLESQKRTWHDISQIIVFRGPGSYTSLRIGLTVANSLASALEIPIVGAAGEAWRQANVESSPEAQLQTKVPITPIYYQAVQITAARK